MAEHKPAKRKRSRWLDFRALFAKWQVLRAQRPLAIKLTILGVLGGILFVILIVGGIAGYFMYNYTQHNPKFCISCHDIMIESYEAWETSEHADVKCHTCHALTAEVIINYSHRILTGMPDKVPPRAEGKILVPSSDCMTCHWGAKQAEKTAWWQKLTEKEVIEGNNVAFSKFHAIHYFNGQTECETCHGDKQLHVFTSQPEDCLDCHQDQQEKTHAAKTVELACLNCHTDRTANLYPDREKCLSCHGGDDRIRQQLLAAGTIDVKYAQPTEETITNAIKIVLPEKAPMETLDCATCHTSHQEQAQPSAETCISCHPSIENVGQHTLHLQFVDSDCLQCHQPHSWSITEEWAQEECAKCHDYQAPVTFIQAN